MQSSVSNSRRRHALFIFSDVGLATDVAPVKGDSPTSCTTAAGLVDWPTGSMGGMNFGAPCRLRPEARLARCWGLRLRHEVKDSHAHLAKREYMPNDFSMLALRPQRDHDPPATVNGVICMAYTDQELAAVETFYGHFSYAMLAQIPISQFEAVSWQSLPEVDIVHCVVANDIVFKPLSYTAPILQSYLDHIAVVFSCYGKDFQTEFFHTTQGWSQYWLDDRPRETEWGHPTTIKHFMLDNLIRKLMPRLFECRKHISSYAAHVLDPLDSEPSFEQTTAMSGPIKQKDMNYFTFGMGSLINTPSRVGTAGIIAQSAIPVRITAEYEFCPCWNFQNYAGGSQLTAGGMVMRSDERVKDPEAETIGIIYPCPGDDAAMAAQDEREVGYTRYNIPLQFIHSLDHWQKVPAGITVFQYVPNTELKDDHPGRAKNADGSLTRRAPFPPREYPLSQTYVDTCILGCLEYSAEMARKWIRGFVGWPDSDNPYWLNDRLVPRRPWLEQPQFQLIDSILADALPKSMSIRQLPSEYGGHYWGCDVGPHTPRVYCLTASADLDVRYLSYAEHSRDEMRAPCEETQHFWFETAHLMVKQNIRKFVEVYFKYDYPALSIPCRLSKDAGFRRSFCHHIENTFKRTEVAITGAGDGGARDINGLLYPVPRGWAQPSGEPPEEGEADPRSTVWKTKFQRVEIRRDFLTVLRSWMCIPESARVFTYVCMEPEPACFDWPISQTSLDSQLQEGLESFGEDFCKEFVDTTDGWVSPDGSAYWLNDRHLARRPWVSLGGKYKIFDRIILDSKSPCIPVGTLYKRRLPEEYLAMASKHHPSSPKFAAGPD